MMIFVSRKYNRQYWQEKKREYITLGEHSLVKSHDWHVLLSLGNATKYLV